MSAPTPVAMQLERNHPVLMVGENTTDVTTFGYAVEQSLGSSNYLFSCSFGELDQAK
jgi:hypothetical protein